MAMTMSVIKYGKTTYVKELLLKDGEELKPDLICSSCTGIIKDPVQTLCGHRYCKECLLEIVELVDTCSS